MGRRWIRLLFLAVFLFSLDFSLKYFVYHYLPYPVLVFKTGVGIDFFIQCVTNKGAAWGMFSSFHTPLLIFRMLMIAFLLFYLVSKRKTLRGVTFLILVITGASCNVFDCFYYGYVVDMLHFTFWGNSYGIFNLADSFIFLGALGLILNARQQHATLSH